MARVWFILKNPKYNPEDPSTNRELTNIPIVELQHVPRQGERVSLRPVRYSSWPKELLDVMCSTFVVEEVINSVMLSGPKDLPGTIPTESCVEVYLKES